MTRSADLLQRVGEVLLPPTPAQPRRATWSASPASLPIASEEVATVVDRYAAEHGAMRESWDLSDLPAWLQAFQTAAGLGGLAGARRLGRAAARRARRRRARPVRGGVA